MAISLVRVFIVVFIFSFFSLCSESKENQSCFEQGNALKHWYFIKLPKDIGETVWTATDVSEAVIFSVSDKYFNPWLKECGINLHKTPRDLRWEQESNDGANSIAVYKDLLTDKVCIEVSYSMATPPFLPINPKGFQDCANNAFSKFNENMDSK